MMRIAAALVVSGLTVGAALADDKQDIEEVNAKFEQALTAGDAAAIAALYAEDAVMFPPASPPVEGRANIQALWQSFIDAGVTSLDLNATEIASSGDLAYDLGTFSITTKTDSGEMPGSGKYLVVWHKSADGTWQLYRDIWNEDAAPQ
jgi:uncharacterized protein (TIGR02246 family)